MLPRYRTLLGLAVLALSPIILSCGGISPYSVLGLVNSAATNHQSPQGGGGAGTGAGGVGIPIAGGVSTTCDLASERKNITVLLKNESAQNIVYSISFLASTGSGGFVCDADRQRYLNGGYVSAGASITLGCRSLTTSDSAFRGGTEILVRRVGRDAGNNLILLGPNLGGKIETATKAVAPLDGITLIPTPEVIVLGDDEASSNALFVCQSGNPCTQGGFTYVNAQRVQIDDVFASATQDTQCNVGAGSRPEWRLRNPNSLDQGAAASEYVAGANITLTVLNRLFAAASLNKVVWAVVGPVPNLEQIHSERR